MLFVVFAIIGIWLIIIQTTLLPELPQWLGRPDLVFILIAFIAYRFAWIPGIILVFWLGWVMDVIAGVYLGVYPLMCLLTFTALKLLTGRSPIKESTYQVPLVGASYFLVQLCISFYYSVTAPETVPDWSPGMMLQRGLLVVVAAVPLFIIFNGLHEMIEKRRLRNRSLRRKTGKPA